MTYEREVQALAVTWMAAAVGVLLLALCSGASCGPPLESADNGTRLHAQIALIIEQPLLATHVIIDAREEAEAFSARRNAATPEEGDRRIAELKQRFMSVDQAWAFTKQAYDLYVTAIADANEHDTPVTHQLALALLSKWRSLIDAAQAIGLELPPIPEPFSKGVANGPA